MIRTVASVIVGYVVLALIVFGGLSVAYLLLGPDLSFRDGSYDVSLLWIAISLAIGFGAAWLGGWIARRIARTANGPRALAIAVVVLGLVLAMPVLFGAIEAPDPRSGTVPAMEAMRQARTPLWIMLINPLLGALGVLLGGGVLGDGEQRRERRRKRDRPIDPPPVD